MTEYFLGKREQIAVAEEAGGYAILSPNTMADDGFFLGKSMKIEPDITHEWQEVLSAGADTREIEEFRKGPTTYNFGLVFHPTNWKFLKYCTHGSVTNDGTSPTTHTFSITNEPKSFTLEWAKRGNPNDVITLTGCVIKSWTLNFASGTGPTEGFITITANCVAKTATRGTTITSLTPPTEEPFQYRMAKLTYNSTEIIELNNGEISVDNGIAEEDSRYASVTLDQEIGEPIPKTIRNISRFNINQKDGEFTQDWEDMVEVPGTNKLEFIRGTTPDDNIVFTFTGLYLKSVPNPTNLEGISNIDLVGVIKSLGIVAKDALIDY
jgi:hypothetical protein